jgi:hypothetical protein
LSWLIIGERSGPTSEGYWDYGQARYLGVEFKISGKEHFGWARFKNSSYYAAALTGYAYETIANKSIITGKTKGPDDASVEESNATTVPTHQPATPGLLALGSLGLSIWRREELVGARSQAN